MTTEEHNKLSDGDRSLIFNAFMTDMNKHRIEVKSPFQFSSWLRAQDTNTIKAILKPALK